MKSKKIKAFVMIFLMISLIFYTANTFRSLNQDESVKNNNFKFNYFQFIKQDLIPNVNADDKVCCQKTKVNSDFNGASCVYTEQNNCDLSAGAPLATSCEQTDYCKPSCCINTNGQCQDNVEAATCTNVGGAARAGKCEDIGQCKVGCCNLPSGSSLIPQGQCAASVRNFPNLQLDKVFDPSIQDEQQCIQQSQGTEEGCCVLSNQCSFGTRSECASQSGDFKLNNLCSYSALGCPVTEKHHTQCYQGKVYWYDSSNNRENIYGTNYRQDGQVVLPKNSCSLDHQGLSNNVQCGNCEYSLGTICNDATPEFKSQLSKDFNNKVNNQCVSLACINPEQSKKNSQGTSINPWMDVKRRENGESWCQYESKTGGGNDLVGSRHYIHRCINGKEVTTECSDRRKEICVQNDIPGNLIDPKNSQQKPLTFADCVPNNWEQCLSANEDTEDCGININEASVSYATLYPTGDTKTPNGPCDVFLESRDAPFSTAPSLENMFKPLKDQDNNFNSCVLKTMCKKKTCEEEVTGLCYFNKNVGLCAPSVPPGSLGKEQDFSALTNGDKIGFNFECKEIWVKGAGPKSRWNCEANCGCARSFYADKWNNYCTNLGDLGAKYNVAGKYSALSFIHKRTSQGDAADISGPADGISPAPSFNIFTRNEKPLTGDFWSLLSASTNILILNRNLDANLKPGFFSLYDNWLGVISITGISFILTSIVYSFAVGGGFTYTAFSLAATTPFLTSGVSILGVSIPIIGVIILASLLILTLINLIWSAQQEDVVYQLSCNSYSPPSKGEDCKLCNDKTKFRECTEYLCKSLGKACELENKNFPGNQTCIWKNPSDTLPVVIQPLAIAPRTLNDFILTPSSSGNGGGYEFKETLKSFDSVDVGIKVSSLDKKTTKLIDSQAECKISRNINFDYEKEGEFFTGDSLILTEHKKKIPIATKGISPNEDRIELETGKENTFYVKCKSVNDIVNANAYFIKMRLELGPDLAPPLIKEFNLPDNSFMKYNLNNTNLILYYEDQTGVNLNGGCKYSEVDQDYKLMESNMSCSQTKLISGTNQGKFACSTNLKLNPNKDNVFYFRCQDKSENKNVNTQSTALHLKASQPLKIIDKGPIGNVLTTKVNLTLSTDVGSENGKSTCYYAGGRKDLVTKDLTFSGAGVKFTSTNSNNHETRLSLQNEQDYLFYVWCRDIAGNEAHDKIEFHTTTPDLIIEDTQPNQQTFYTDQVRLSVATSGGIKGNGESTCSYNGDLNGYFNEYKQELQDKFIQTKNLTLITSGTTYDLNITCTDQYKTTAKEISFTVDYAAYPQIIRVYRTQNLLNVLFDNPADCRYSSNEPNFDFNQTSTKMIDLPGSNAKQVQISSTVIYIKCQDTRTNRFSPTYKIYP